MHLKLAKTRLVKSGYKIDSLKIRKTKRDGLTGYTSDDSCESNLTSVGVDYVPLCEGFAHIVDTELGDDPHLPGEKVIFPKKRFIWETTQPTTAKKKIVIPKPPPPYQPGFQPDQQNNNQQQHEVEPTTETKLQLEQILKLNQAMQEKIKLLSQKIKEATAANDSRHEYRGGIVPERVVLAAVNTVPNKNDSRHKVAPTSTKGKRPVSTDVKRPVEKKRRRTKTTRTKENHQGAEVGSNINSDESVDDDTLQRVKRFSGIQSQQWIEKFEELEDFKKEHGHCQVPMAYDENPALARWVKRQRYQYKLKMENKGSVMTDSRIRKLEEIGFIWESHTVQWAERLKEMTEYFDKYGNCNVPNNHPHAQLYTWVKSQRRQYKLMKEGRPSTITPDRIEALDRLGFSWEIRQKGVIV